MHRGVKVSTAGGVNRIVLPAVSVKLYKMNSKKYAGTTGTGIYMSAEKYESSEKQDV